MYTTYISKGNVTVFLHTSQTFIILTQTSFTQSAGLSRQEPSPSLSHCCCNSIANVILYMYVTWEQKRQMYQRWIPTVSLYSVQVCSRWQGLDTLSNSILYAFVVYSKMMHAVNSKVSSYCTIKSLVIGCQYLFQLNSLSCDERTKFSIYSTQLSI